MQHNMKSKNRKNRSGPNTQLTNTACNFCTRTRGHGKSKQSEYVESLTTVAIDSLVAGGPEGKWRGKSWLFSLFVSSGACCGHSLAN